MGNYMGVPLQLSDEEQQQQEQQEQQQQQSDQPKPPKPRITRANPVPNGTPVTLLMIGRTNNKKASQQQQEQNVVDPTQQQNDPNKSQYPPPNKRMYGAFYYSAARTVHTLTPSAPQKQADFRFPPTTKPSAVYIMATADAEHRKSLMAMRENVDFPLEKKTTIESAALQDEVVCMLWLYHQQARHAYWAWYQDTYKEQIQTYQQQQQEKEQQQKEYVLVNECGGEEQVQTKEEEKEKEQEEHKDKDDEPNSTDTTPLPPTPSEEFSICPIPGPVQMVWPSARARELLSPHFGATCFVGVLTEVLWDVAPNMCFLLFRLAPPRGDGSFKPPETPDAIATNLVYTIYRKDDFNSFIPAVGTVCLVFQSMTDASYTTYYPLVVINQELLEQAQKFNQLVHDDFHDIAVKDNDDANQQDFIMIDPLNVPPQTIVTHTNTPTTPVHTIYQDAPSLTPVMSFFFLQIIITELFKFHQQQLTAYFGPDYLTNPQDVPFALRYQPFDLECYMEFVKTTMQRLLDPQDVTFRTTLVQQVHATQYAEQLRRELILKAIDDTNCDDDDEEEENVSKTIKKLRVPFAKAVPVCYKSLVDISPEGRKFYKTPYDPNLLVRVVFYVNDDGQHLEMNLAENSRLSFDKYAGLSGKWYSPLKTTTTTTTTTTTNTITPGKNTTSSKTNSNSITRGSLVVVCGTVDAIQNNRFEEMRHVVVMHHDDEQQFIQTTMDDVNNNNDNNNNNHSHHPMGYAPIMAFLWDHWNAAQQYFIDHQSELDVVNDKSFSDRMEFIDHHDTPSSFLSLRDDHTPPPTTTSHYLHTICPIPSPKNVCNLNVAANILMTAQLRVSLCVMKEVRIPSGVLDLSEFFLPQPIKSMTAGSRACPMVHLTMYALEQCCEEESGNGNDDENNNNNNKKQSNGLEVVERPMSIPQYFGPLVRTKDISAFPRAGSVGLMFTGMSPHHYMSYYELIPPPTKEEEMLEQQEQQKQQQEQQKQNVQEKEKEDEHQEKKNDEEQVETAAPTTSKYTYQYGTSTKRQLLIESLYRFHIDDIQKVWSTVFNPSSYKNKNANTTTNNNDENNIITAADPSDDNTTNNTNNKSTTSPPQHFFQVKNYVDFVAKEREQLYSDVNTTHYQNLLQQQRMKYAVGTPCVNRGVETPDQFTLCLDLPPLF